ncbi:MAG: 3-deoxy-manno-octulosonate cytidylyltransferase [Desulfobacteraceae bacterium]|jgi:3-deoxy-manno-octulosonate cytidylyltransferase (CMP-KDO synthetase)
MRTVIFIPARYGSTRLPGKPLVDILGKPMIQHVYEKALSVAAVDAVVVVTDDQRVVNAVNEFGGKAVMTSPDHVSGTDRMVEVMAQFPADLYVNLQGDEPMVRPEDIAVLINGMHSYPDIQVGTLCHPISTEEALNPNCVKVVLGSVAEALYFSRAPIPYPRESDAASYLKHVGIYAYRQEVLAGYAQMQRPMLEKAEMLEQLRLMYAGIHITVFKVAPTGPGVDTPDDLERVRALMNGTPEPELPSLADVKLLITDVDGVLTDGGLLYDADGENLKRFNSRDGLGTTLLRACGVQVAVVSGRDSAPLRRRVADLKIPFYYFGVVNKAAVCKEIMQAAGVTPQQTAFIGDDSIDLSAFDVCHFSFTVADAADYIKQAARETLTSRGGHGAFREVVDKILTARGQAHVFKSTAGFAEVINEKKV